MNTKQLFDSIGHLTKLGLVPHIIGHFGIGKSSVVYQYAKANNFDSVIEIRTGELADIGDLKGLPDFEEENGVKIGTKFLPPSKLPKSGRHILFLDEINRAGSKDVMQGLFQLIYDKRTGDYTLPKDCVIIAASNPDNGDYSTIDFADPAFQDRFVHIKFEPTVADWAGYMAAKNLNKEQKHLLKFFETNPDMLQAKNLSDFNLGFVQPSRRSVDTLISKLLPEVGQSDLFFEICKGLIGITTTLSLQSYLNENAYTEEKLGYDFVVNYKTQKHKLEDYIKANPDRHDIYLQINESFQSEVNKKFIENGNKPFIMSNDEVRNLVTYVKALPLTIVNSIADYFRQISVGEEIRFMIQVLPKDSEEVVELPIYPVLLLCEDPEVGVRTDSRNILKEVYDLKQAGKLE